MHMAELKTKRTKASVSSFLRSIDDDKKRKDAQALNALFKEVTGLPAAMWGESMIGFGSYHYKSERSTQEGDWPLIAFSPRKQNLTIYVMPGFKDYGEYLEKLGPHKKSSGCLYIKQLSDIHIPTLQRLIKRATKDMQKKYKSKTK